MSDLLPAFVLAGVAIGIAPVTIQIGAFTGVTGSVAGIAAGLVETMREIGGAVAVAAASTVLIGGAVIGAPGSAAARDSLADTFHSAFVVIPAFAVLGAVVAAVGFTRGHVGRAEDDTHTAEIAAVRSIAGGSDHDARSSSPAA